MKKVTYLCDVDGCENQDTETIKIQVLFTTDQTEGRGMPTYLSIHDLDICEHCINKILKGNYLYGSGAQGYNKFWFKQ
jgi:hypothetical protein